MKFHNYQERDFRLLAADVNTCTVLVCSEEGRPVDGVALGPVAKGSSRVRKTKGVEGTLQEAALLRTGME